MRVYAVALYSVCCLQVSEQEAREFLAKPRQDSAAGLVEWIVDVTDQFCAGAMSADADEKCRMMMLVSYVHVPHCDPLYNSWCG